MAPPKRQRRNVLTGAGVVPVSIPGLSTAKVLRVDVERDAEDVADTFGDDVGLFPVMAEFAS